MELHKIFGWRSLGSITSSGFASVHGARSGEGLSASAEGFATNRDGRRVGLYAGAWSGAAALEQRPL